MGDEAVVDMLKALSTAVQHTLHSTLHPVCTDRKCAGLTDLAQCGTEGITSGWDMTKTRTAHIVFVALMAVMRRAAPHNHITIPRDPSSMPL